MKDKVKSIKKQQVKDTVLFAYIVLTVMGLYSAAMFTLGTKYNAHADAAGVVIVHTPSK